MKKSIRFLCLLLMTVVLVACTESKPSEETVLETTSMEFLTETQTTSPAETHTEESSETQTEEPSETLTETPTETQNEAPTEELTESETEGESVLDTGYPVDKLTLGGVDIHSFTLVVQNDGLECIRTAANELILYMEKATGYVIPEEDSDYEIVIGVTDRDTPAVQEARAMVKEDGYVLLMDGNRLYITGSSDRGTMYGVYCFMEDYLGVRFLASDCTVIRDNSIVRIPADVYTLHNPTFVYRDTFWYAMTNNQTLSNHLKDNAPRKHVPEIGGGYSFAVSIAHTILPLAGMPHEIGKQLCLTDESVYQKVLAGVRKWLSQSPNAKFISVSQSDGSGGNCQCENCKAIDDREGTPMGSLLTFVNRIAADIKDEYPNVYVETLAYSYTEQPPKTIKPADNVMIRLCPSPCNACSFADGTCEQATRYRELIRKWSEIAPNLFIWTYTTNYQHYLSPYANFDQLWENVQLFKENNVKGLFMQGNHTSESGEFGELRAYLISKLLWDPDMTKEEYYTHMDEFLEGYYGPGWQHIRAYIDEVCNQVNETYHEEYVSKLTAPLDLLPPPLIRGKRQDITYSRKLLAYWDAALTEATDEKHIAHLEKSSIQVYYYGAYLGTSDEYDARKQTATELIKKYGITQWRENVKVPISW